MIDRREAMDFSREFGLAANVIEKDYVLSWVLAGISNHFGLQSNWVFKGGTCLKKCYFETYRFSEDLDFTIINQEDLNEESLTTAFISIAEWIYETTGIEIPKDLINFETYENQRGHIFVQGKISYRGPMQTRGPLPRIKLDLTKDELLVLEPVSRDIHHPYSDKPEQGFQIQCYCFEEVFAEKIRALGERERPRDLYDVIHLYRHDDIAPDRPLILVTLEKKCEFKAIPVPTYEALKDQPERAELESEWENMLAHQLLILPPFEQFWEVLPIFFKWLYSDIEKVPQPSMPISQPVDQTWRPPVMAQAWRRQIPMEAIRFAAANRLCVDLAYKGTHRLIEPYSLRRTRAGKLLLCTVKHHTREPRNYRVDRIQGAKVTNKPFTPHFRIELTASGRVSIPRFRKSDY